MYINAMFYRYFRWMMTEDLRRVVPAGSQCLFECTMPLTLLSYPCVT
jgi:hypothetical protein